MTETINQTTKHESLTEALVAFQSELPEVGKGSTNSELGSKYGDLADISKVVLPAIARQGLAFVCTPTLNDHGFVLAYSLLHESGERIDGEYPLNAAGSDQQKGASITYARRYALGAVTGVVPDADDDGNAAVAPNVEPPADWKKRIEDATEQAELKDVYQNAVAEGWASPEVMKALTARKKELNGPADTADESSSAATPE